MNKIRILFLMLFCGIYGVEMQSKSIKELWIALPDSMIAYLNQAARAECINLSERGLEPQVNNKLGDKTRIDTLTTDFMSATLTKASTLQMRLLPTNGDSIICMVRTYYGPIAESTVALYTQEWQKIEDITFSIDDMVQRPDTLEQAEYENRKLYLDPYFIRAELSPTADTISLSVGVGNLPPDEKDRIDAILMHRKLKWDGKSFN